MVLYILHSVSTAFFSCHERSISSVIGSSTRLLLCITAWRLSSTFSRLFRSPANQLQLTLFTTHSWEITHLAFLEAGFSVFFDSAFSVGAVSAARLPPASASAVLSSFLLAGFPEDFGFSSFLLIGLAVDLGFSSFLLAGLPVGFGFSSFLLAVFPDDLGLASLAFLLAGFPPFKVLSGSWPYIRRQS